jgi:hypothetical protein
MHNYLSKIAIALAIVVGLSIILRVRFVLPIQEWTSRAPVWALGLVEIFEEYGWTFIVAMILAGVWQIAERH